MVSPNHPMLQREDGSWTIGACDDNVKTIYISDDLDLPIGKIRLRAKGSSGGQNGLKNIIAHLGSQEFKRIRIGIGNNKNYDTKDYVLGKISKDDQVLFGDAKVRAANAAVDFISKPFERVMGAYN